MFVKLFRNSNLKFIEHGSNVSNPLILKILAKFQKYFIKKSNLPLDKKIRVGYVVVKSGMKMFKSGIKGGNIPSTF